MYKIQISDTEDPALDLLLKLEQAPRDNLWIQFAPDTYHFYAERAYESLCCVSNNGRKELKRTGLPVAGRKQVTIDGGGSLFLLHNLMNLLLVENSSHVVLQNFVLDMARPADVEGVVEQAQENGLVLKLKPEDAAALTVEHGALVLHGEGWEAGPSGLISRFIGLGKGIVPGSHDVGLGNDLGKLTCAKEGDRLIFKGKMENHPRPGEIVVIRFGFRFNPAIFLRNS